MGTHVNYTGLVIAGIGFFLTRFTVTLTIYEASVRFYLAGVVPLSLGLGLAAFGVALAVADVDPALVRTTAVWCVVGAGTMLVLVVLTLLGSTTGGVPELATVRSRTYLSNFLIGGSVGGTLTGLYAARAQRQRAELRQRANRLEVLNRMLRHEVLNAVSVIRGYTTIEVDDRSAARAKIEKQSDAITAAIEEVKYLTLSGDRGQTTGKPVELADCVAESVDRVSGAYPGVEISVDVPADLTVRATDRLTKVFEHLVENAAVHAGSDDSGVDISATTTPTAARVSVRDDGPGLPENQRALLETGDIEEYDDPEAGFGLNVVRLLVEEFGGRIETDVTDAGTTITVVVPRAEGGPGGLRLDPARAGVRPAIPHLIVTFAAAIVAGVVYGVAAEVLGGSVGFIGVYYGVENAVVGWIAHEFHSVVFAFAFASLVSLVPAASRDSLPTYVAAGVGWGIFLWAFAAGIVSPVWLRLLGVPAPIPNLSGMLLASHLVWGGSLGVLIALGYRHAVPWLGSVAGSGLPE